MPDITMCLGRKGVPVAHGTSAADIIAAHGTCSCPRLHECYRAQAKPDPLKQSYWGEAPFADDGSCVEFLVIRSYRPR